MNDLKEKLNNLETIQEWLGHNYGKEIIRARIADLCVNVKQV